jgi:hypothetical protein
MITTSPELFLSSEELEPTDPELLELLAASAFKSLAERGRSVEFLRDDPEFRSVVKKVGLERMVGVPGDPVEDGPW